MPKILPFVDIIMAFVGPFISIAIIQNIFDQLNNYTINNQTKLFSLLGSFGAVTTVYCH